MLTIEPSAQSHAEIVASLRQKIVAMRALGILGKEGSDLYEGQIVLLLGEVERQRDKCEKQAEQWLQKYHYALGRREAFTMLRSLVEQLINASIQRAQTEVELEEAEREGRGNYVRVAPVEPVEPVEAPAAPPLPDLPRASLKFDLQGGADARWVCGCGRDFKSKRARATHQRACDKTVGKASA